MNFAILFSKSKYISPKGLNVNTYEGLNKMQLCLYFDCVHIFMIMSNIPSTPPPPPKINKLINPTWLDDAKRPIVLQRGLLFGEWMLLRKGWGGLLAPTNRQRRGPHVTAHRTHPSPFIRAGPARRLCNSFICRNDRNYQSASQRPNEEVKVAPRGDRACPKQNTRDNSGRVFFFGGRIGRKMRARGAP